MKKIYLLLLSFLILTGGLSFGQQAEITDLKLKDFRGISPIYTKNQVYGYFVLYMTQKKSRKIAEFNLDIFDTELKLKKRTPIEITKNSNIDDQTFNGEHFLFVFNDMWKKTITYICADKDGNIVKTKGINVEKYAESTASVYPTTGGFLIVRPIKEKKWGYSVEKIDINLNTVWEKRFNPEAGFLAVDYIYSVSDRLVILELGRPKILSSKIRANIRCLNSTDGSQVFIYPLYDGQDTGVPSAMLVDNENNIVTSGMFFEGEKWDSRNSDGIFFLKISPTGEKKEYKKYTWDSGIQQVLKKGTEKRFGLTGKPKVLFHTIELDKDGNYQVIGETFRKSIRIIMNSPIIDLISGKYIIGWQTENDKSSSLLEILDFIIFNFDKQGTMTNINLIQKPHVKIACYHPYNAYGALALAMQVKGLGLFGYNFTQKDPQTNNELLIATIHDKKEPHAAIYSIEKGSQSVLHKIMFDKKIARKGRVGVLQANEKKVCVYILNKKERKLKLYFEPIKL